MKSKKNTASKATRAAGCLEVIQLLGKQQTVYFALQRLRSGLASGGVGGGGWGGGGGGGGGGVNVMKIHR